MEIFRKKQGIRKIWLGNRYYIEDVIPYTIIDSKENVAIFCGHCSGICKKCWDIIIEEGIKKLWERRDGRCGEH